MVAGKYTALEVLQALDQDFEFDGQVYEAEEVFGKFRVRINGIAGITKPEHIFRFQPGTEEIKVVVGNETYDLDLDAIDDGVDESTISEGAKQVIEAQGKVKTEEMAAKMSSKGRPEAESETLATKSEQRRLAELEAQKAKEDE